MEWQSFFQHRLFSDIFLLHVKKLLFLIMLVNNVLLPLSLLPFFIHRNIISSWTISERKERNIPLDNYYSTLLYYFIYYFQIPYSCFSEIIYFCYSFSLTAGNTYQFLVEDITSFCWSRSPYRSCINSFFKNVDTIGMVSDFSCNCRRIGSFFKIET